MIFRWFRRRELRAQIEYAQAELSISIARFDNQRADRLRKVLIDLHRMLSAT